MQARLTAASPFAFGALLEFLALRAVPGVEEVSDGCYRRTLALAGGPALVQARPDARGVEVHAWLSDEADGEAALAAVARIFDVAARPRAIDRVLRADPALAPLVAATPGLRSPGTADGAELLVRAITGQQVSVLGARTTLARMTLAHGDPLPASLATAAAPTHLFPSPARLAEADPAALGMPRARGAAIVGASRACADGLRLEPGADVRDELLALRGVGPWTADYVAMRALGDRDAYLPGDLGVRHGLARLDGADPERWRPYRAHAVHHLWHALS